MSRGTEDTIQEERPIALLAGFDAVTAEACRRRLDGVVRVVTAASEDEAADLLARMPVVALCLGAGFAERRALDLLERAEEVPGAEGRVNLVFAGGPDLSPFQDWIDRDRLFYLTAEPIPPEDVAALLRSSLERRRGSAPPVQSEERRFASAVAAVAAAGTAAAAGQAAALAAAELLEAERGHCLFHDPGRDLLWVGDEGDPDARRESAAVGLVSFVTRTGLPVVLERIGRDPRFDREADDPPANGDERFVAVPVRASDTEPVLAVLALVRPPGRPPFSEADVRLLRRFAEQAAPLLSRLIPEEESAILGSAPTLFREQALRIHQAGMRIEGDLLRADPSWMQWTYRLLLAVLATALLFSLLGTVREYASGPAVVRLGGRTDLRATAAGTVHEVTVERGDRVAAGQVLVRLHGAQEAAGLERIEREIELQLVNRLRNPADTAAERSLLSLRAERELARSRVDERALRAPAAGVVDDVRVRPGQPVSPGQILTTLAGPGGERTVMALLPGEFRPLLKPGMPLRLELQGYRYAYQHLVVEEVGGEVVGPAEARRYLGEEIADAATLGGPVVLVTARVPSLTFEAEGRTRRYHDGMWGKAEVRVRSERILVALVPALRALFKGDYV
jgi:multidrug efflux pump subunit AcrA (membrane-fusion protein)/GAF domain-containing protein